MRYLYLLLLLGTYFSCGTAKRYILDQSFTLQSHQLHKCKGCPSGDKLPVTFLGVKEDSRCPKYTNCVWEGQAIVQLLVATDTVSLRLSAGKQQDTHRTVGGYELHALHLDPYPIAGQSIQAGEYRLQLRIQSADRTTGEPTLKSTL